MQHPRPKAEKHCSDARSHRTRHAVAVGTICVLVGLAYANSLLNGFAFDDGLIIENNPLIRELRHLPTLFTTDYWEGAGIVGELHGDALYRPLVLTSYMLNYLTMGLAAWAFHLTNVLIHLGVVITLYGVACRLGLGWPGALAAVLVFAVHPLNTEAVTGVVGRAELMMALGVLLAFYCDLAKNPPEEPAPKLSAASLAAFGLGLFSKEQAIMFPALLFVADGMRTSRSGADYWQIYWNARLRYLGYILVCALYLAVRITVVGTAMPPLMPIENPLASFDSFTSLINAVKVAGTYLWLTVWPANLSADYSYNSLPITASALDPAVWVSALVWIAFLALGVIAFCERRRALAVGVAITFLFFLPVSNLLIHIGTIMGERLFYLPLAGLCLALGSGWNMVCETLARHAQYRWRMALGVGAAILALAPLTLRTVARNKDWESDATLFASIVRTHPRNAKGRFLMANVYLRQRDWRKALARYESALAILPEYTQVIKFARAYAGVLLRLGRTHEAIAVLTEATGMNPEVNDPWIHRLLSVAYELNRDYALAAESLQRAIEVGRGLSMTSTESIFEDYNQLARLYALEQRNADSRRALEDALSTVRDAPDLPVSQRTIMTAQVLGNLALLDTTEGAYTEAEEKYLRLLELLNSPGLEIPKQLRIKRLRDYAGLLRKMSREEQAGAIDQEAAALESR